MILEQADPAGTTAWLAAVGLVHLTKEVPADPVDYYEQATAGLMQSRPSRWVKDSGVWSLEIDQPVGFDDLLRWFEGRFAGRELGIEFVGRDPWWRTRGNTSPAALGQTILAELSRVSGPVDLVAELRVAAAAIRTDKLLGWVIDRHWVPTDAEQRLDRPLIRYALAYVGATIAQHWPGHMIGTSAVGHLWDGQPSGHPLTEHTVIRWEPITEPGPAGLKYPAWWGPGSYATVGPATWQGMVRDRWTGVWLSYELLGRTEAKRLRPELPEPHMTRSRVPLWRRSVLLGGADEHPAGQTGAPLVASRRGPSAAARQAGDRPLDAVGVAEHASLSVATIRSYMRDDAMPPADGRMGQSLWWWASTIDTWQRTRPTVGRPKS